MFIFMSHKFYVALILNIDVFIDTLVFWKGKRGDDLAIIFFSQSQHSHFRLGTCVECWYFNIIKSYISTTLFFVSPMICVASSIVIIFAFRTINPSCILLKCKLTNICAINFTSSYAYMATFPFLARKASHGYVLLVSFF